MKTLSAYSILLLPICSIGKYSFFFFNFKLKRLKNDEIKRCIKMPWNRNVMVSDDGGELGGFDGEGV